MRIALIQFDAVPEKPDLNTRRIEQLAVHAASRGRNSSCFTKER